MNTYLSEIKSILSRPHLQKLARECGFFKRKGLIEADAFFDMLLYCANRPENSSLAFMSSHLERCHDTVVSRTAINNRFNDGCELFVGAVLSEVLRERYKEWTPAYGEKVFARFNRVRIKDSTKFQLPDSLKDDFPGVGGCAGEAGVSIQFEYDIKSGDILYMSIGNGSSNDHEEKSEACAKIENGDLIIRDLGYFSREVFQTFMEEGAYFLSRLDSQITVITEKERKKLPFKEIYREMKKKGIDRKEVTVLIGSEKKIKVRLIMETVPEEVYQKRVCNAKKRNKVNSRKKHRKSGSKEPLRLKDETRARYRFTLLITNIESDRLHHSQALSLYRIRWQVELVFKIWKGTYRVDEVGQMKKQRFICLLMAKLILLAIRQQLTYRLQGKIVSEAGKRARKKIEYLVLSPNKVAKTLHELFREFYRMIRGKMSIASYAAMLETVLSRNHELERGKNKLSFPELLFIFTCKTIK
jgi:hypothetical protein